MTTPEQGDVYIYRIDRDDRIVYVSDNWLQFASENQAADTCAPTDVLNKPIWEFIAGKETRHLYEVILEKVRSAKEPVKIPVRCDSPDLRRFLGISVKEDADEVVEFVSRVILVQERQPVHLLQYVEKRSNDFLRMCSFCKKIAISESDWMEVEDAISHLGIFEAVQLPQLTHTVCLACYESLTAGLR